MHCYQVSCLFCLKGLLYRSILCVALSVFLFFSQSSQRSYKHCILVFDTQIVSGQVVTSLYYFSSFISICISGQSERKIVDGDGDIDGDILWDYRMRAFILSCGALGALLLCYHFTDVLSSTESVFRVIWEQFLAISVAWKCCCE